MALSNSTDRFNGVLSTLAIKAPCVAVAIANITLSGEQTVNGVAVVSGDRVLVTAQTSAVNNGIYDVSSGAWTRSADFDGNRDVVSGTLVTVATATVGRNPFYQITTANPITIGSTAINFMLADGPNVSYALTAVEDAAGLTVDDIDDAIEPAHVIRYGTNTIPATTDMTVAARNAMLAYLHVTFPPEAVRCTGELPLRSGHHLHGGGIGSTRLILDGTVTTSHGLLYANSGGSAAFITDIQISDMTLDGLVVTASFSEHQHLLSLNGVDNVIVSRVKFLGFRGDGIYLGSVDGERHNKHVDISHCIFDGVNNDNRQGVTVIDGDHISIDTNYFYDLTRSNMPGAIDIEPNANAYHIVRNIGITNNTFSNVTGSTGVITFILTAATLTNQPETFVISGNKYDTVKTALVFDSNANYARPIDLAFTGNSGKVGNYADIQGRLEGLTYSANTFYATGRGFLGFNAADELIDATISGNTITGDGVSSKGWVLRSGDNINFSGNVYRGLTDFTYQLSNATAVLDNVHITGETCADGNAVEFGAGTITGVEIVDNNFKKCTNIIEGTIPADTVIRNNAGADELVAAANVITAAESGKTFYLNLVGGFTSTLPLPHRGLKYKFIVATAPTTAYIITTNAGANILQGTFLDIVGELVAISAQDTLNFVASIALVGDSLEVESDGTSWFCTAFSKADGGITVSVT